MPQTRGDVAPALAQVAAQHLDVGVHGAVLAEVIVVPHLLQDLFAAEGDALVRCQEDQQVELLGRQAHFLARHADGVAGCVDGQVAESHGAVGSLAPGHGAVEHGPDAGHQLARGEGLDHIVVRAALQARQFIVFLAACGQDDDRRVDVAGAHLPQAGHAVHERHHHIQDHQIVSAAAQQRKRRRAVACLLADIARILQMLPDQFPDTGFIINDQNFCHLWLPPHSKVSGILRLSYREVWKFL